MKGNLKRMNGRTSVKELYMPFLRKCWREGLTDALISTVVPFDNSTITGFRHEEKYPATNKKLRKENIDTLFQCIAEFPWVLNGSNPLRTNSNVAFWKRHEELFQYFMELRDNLKAYIQAKDFEVEQRCADPSSVCEPIESIEPSTTDIETEACCADTRPSPIYECSSEETEETAVRRKTTIKMQLRDVVHRAIEYDMYDLVEDLVKVLAEHF
jgi:hypothetical protein